MSPAMSPRLAGFSGKPTKEYIMKDLESCIGGTFEIIGNHIHKGEKVKAIQVDTIPGCFSPGLLVEQISKEDKKGSYGLKFRVFNVDELKPV